MGTTNLKETSLKKLSMLHLLSPPCRLYQPWLQQAQQEQGAVVTTAVIDTAAVETVSTVNRFIITDYNLSKFNQGLTNKDA